MRGEIMTTEVETAANWEDGLPENWKDVERPQLRLGARGGEPAATLGVTAMVIGALANAAAGGVLVWWLMKDEPAHLAAETSLALERLKGAVIDMGCAAKDTLGTWYLKRPEVFAPPVVGAEPVAASKAKPVAGAPVR
jgi:hypothetical protein